MDAKIKMYFKDFLTEKGLDLTKATAQESADVFNEFYETKKGALKKHIEERGRGGKENATELVETLKQELRDSLSVIDKKTEEILGIIMEPKFSALEKMLEYQINLCYVLIGTFIKEPKKPVEPSHA